MITFNFTDTAFLLRISEYLLHPPHKFFRILLRWTLNNGFMGDHAKRGHSLGETGLGSRSDSMIQLSLGTTENLSFLKIET